MKASFSVSKLGIVLLSALFFINSAFAQTDDEPIKVESSIVVLNTTVTDANGKFVKGLKEKQFQIFEDGKEQKIESFQAEETPFAAVILIDSSGSMTVTESNMVFERVRIARSAAISFLDFLRSDDMVAIYRFDSKVEMVQDFSASRDAPEALFDIKADGMTALNDAIYKASEELAKRSEKRKAIIVLSDGGDTRSRYSSEKALKMAIASQATIYTIDISTFAEKTRFQNTKILKNFADQSGGRFVSAQNGQALREVFKNLSEELRSQYTITYQPTNTAKDGKWRAIEVKNQKADLNIRTRKGYNAPKN
nr:VWFA-related Acidobacterial domain [uncultured bacterium]